MTDRSFFTGHPAVVAPGLLGWRLVTELEAPTVLMITEVEAYAFDDPASHSFRGMTPRNRSMFAPAGTLYVYRSHGIHWCANVATGPEGEGAAILIRAGTPVTGEAVMGVRRGRHDHLCDGPGKVCQALGIHGGHDGLDLLVGGQVRLEPASRPLPHLTTPRIGISRAVDHPWRFVAAGP